MPSHDQQSLVDNANIRQMGVFRLCILSNTMGCAESVSTDPFRFCSPSVWLRLPKYSPDDRQEHVNF